MRQPLFSVAIPTYNRLQFLKKAVASVLNQSYQNIEIVILNNASSDGTKEWLDDLSVTTENVVAVHNDTNVGAIGNLKLIPQHINGDYLVVLSDDDLLDPEFIAIAANDLITYNDAVIWYCRSKIFNEMNSDFNRITVGAPFIEKGTTFVKQSLLGKREAMFCATVFKVDTLRDVGGFIGEKMALDFITRALCAARGEVICNQNVLASYYLQPQGSIMFSASLWFDAVKEIQFVITQRLGKQYEFATIYYRFLIMESFLNRKDINIHNRFYCFSKLIYEHPIWFIVIFLRRIPFLAVRLLPEPAYARLCKFYWLIKSCFVK